MPDYKYIHNKPESEFLTCQEEYSQFCERLGSCLATECSKMKSSKLLHVHVVFECGPFPPTSTLHPPDVIHVMCSQAFPNFHSSSTFVYYTEHKPKNKSGRAYSSQQEVCLRVGQGFHFQLFQKQWGGGYRSQYAYFSNLVA